MLSFCCFMVQMSLASTWLRPQEQLKMTSSTSRRSANLQVLAVVASDGQKPNLIFHESNERLNAITYSKYLEETVFPWAREKYGDH